MILSLPITFSFYAHRRKSSNSGQLTKQVASQICLSARHESMWSSGVTDPLILNLSSTLGEWAA